jgi:signal transduction histidine kinase
MLHLEVSDDGGGLGERRVTGVGFSSMRERAEELGGRWAIEALPAGGTRVKADLPCRPVARSTAPDALS